MMLANRWWLVLLALAPLAFGAESLEASESAAEVIEEVIAEAGTDAGRRCFEDLRACEPGEFDFDETEFNELGYRLLRGGNAMAAIEVFTMNTELFPESANVWDSYGEGCMSDRRFGEAIRGYRRVLALDPENENATAMIARLEGMLNDAAAETTAIPLFAAGTNTGRKGPWLGEEPPGREPKVFAPGIVSTRGQMEYSITFSPKGDELYFARRASDAGRGANEICVCRLTDEGWTAPEVASFSGEHSDYNPCFTKGRQRLLFGSFRPAPTEVAAPGEPALWYVDRTEEGWGEAQLFGAGTYLTAARDGSVYVSTPGGVLRITSPIRPWLHSDPARGPEAFPHLGGHPGVAPDERYILFDSTPANGPTDLYLCWRMPPQFHATTDWHSPRSLAEPLGMKGAKFCGTVSPNGRFLFFTANLDLYWVSTEILPTPGPK